MEPIYNDIGLCYTSSLASDILCYQFLTVNHNIVLLDHEVRIYNYIYNSTTL